MKKIELKGKRFTRLVVLEFSHIGSNRNAYWICQCDCGKQKTVSSNELRTKGTQSCGCLLREKTIQRNKTHGQSNTRLYKIWKGMKTRCENPNYHAFKNYGGRGIVVCLKWQDPAEFIKWAESHGYQEHLEIERMNNDGNYEPSNGCWITWQAQAKNRRQKPITKRDKLGRIAKN